MDRGDFSVPVDQERGRQRVNAAVKLRGGIVADDHAIIHAQFGEEWLDDIPPFIVHRNADHRKTAILVLALHLHEPGNFDLARPAPGGEKIEQHDLALIIFQMDGLAVGILERKFGRRVAIVFGLDVSGGAHRAGRGGAAREKPRGKKRGSENGG